MVEIPAVIFMIVIFVSAGVSFFGGYQIGFGNGCQAEWKMLLIERSKMETQDGAEQKRNTSD
jgi:hypothetical protein